MDLEQQVAEAITVELTRQAEAGPHALSVEPAGQGALSVRGRIDLEALAMAVVGAVAGGP
jgi:hypothetical protein